MRNLEVVHGDSRVVLPALAAAGHAGTVKLAYLDPPFNTGKTSAMGYRDHRSPDEWNELISDVAMGSRELLRADGSLWLHISERQSVRARLALDGVFGEENYVATVYWERTRRPSYRAKHIVNTIDTILIYAKDARQLAPFTSGVTEAGKRVGLAHRGNRLQELVFPSGSVRFGVADGTYAAGDHSTASIQATLTADLVVEDGWNTTPFHLRLPSRYSADRVKVMIDEGAEFYVPQTPFRISYIAPGGRPKMVGSLWSWRHDSAMPTNEDAAKEQDVLADLDSKPFPWAKPEGLLRRIIELSTEPGDLVLDPFAGSGTTAAAAVQTGRQCFAIEERLELVHGLILGRVRQAAAHIVGEQVAQR